jgi:hypothetical protein
MPWTFTQRRKGSTEKSNGRTRAAVWVSVLVHMAAIGGLLVLKPVPYWTSTPKTMEITLVTEAPAGDRANEPSRTVTRQNSSGVSMSPLVPATGPDVAAMPSSPRWSSGIGLGNSFALPTFPKFGLPTRTAALDGLTAAFDGLAAALDCPAVGGSARTAGTRMPCPSAMRSDDLLAHAPAMTQLPLYAAQPSEPGRDSYFPTFKQSHSQIFDDTIFPDEVSPANRALENWIAGLFH